MARRLFLRALRLVVLFYAVTGAGLWFFQEKLLFHPEPLPADFRFGMSVPFEERTVEAGGDRLHSLFARAKEPKGLLVYYHGNAGSLDNWEHVAEKLVQSTGWNVWMMDYPGFGKSTGAVTSEAQLLAAGDAVFAAAAREAGPLAVAVMGRSLGTGLAVREASRNPAVRGLVLEAPYLSVASMAKRLYPWAPLFLLRYPLRSDLLMPDLAMPALVFHGTDDEVIPYEEGKALAALGRRTRLVTFAGGHHDGLSHQPGYWEALREFLQGIGGAGGVSRRRSQGNSGGR